MIINIDSLGGLINLERLSISGNHVEDISELKDTLKLRHLNISYNPIGDLSPIKHILESGNEVNFGNSNTEKDVVNLTNCPLQNPPYEIAKQGRVAILNYWTEQNRLGTQQAYEGRLIIVGEGKVGKTTLLNKLKNPDYQLVELEQTHGINIWRDWTFPVPQIDAKYFASVWDFGGQDIQHLTHQYFFTPGTVFLLVVNKRGNNASSEAVQLNYWFRIIELMGRSEGEKARVLVVHNVFNGDKTNQGINLGPYQERYKDTLSITFKEVNLAQNSGAFNDLCSEIKDALINLPGIGENIIAGWPDIRRKLGDLREQRRISWREFSKICEPKNIIRDESKLLLTRYLARLGEILHYEHGGLLFNNVLLDIDWITTAVYGITESQTIINRNGRFTRKEIVKVWRENGIIDRSDHELMLQLLQMDAFELCWQTESGDYLTPTLFSSVMPTVNPVLPHIELRFHYDYLPKGLIGQLIVRLHKHLEADHYWKDGIFLQREGCPARISRPLSEKDGEQIIEIIVEGDPPKHYALLSWIIEQLETIHTRSFPRIKYIREIPCPCPRCTEGKLGQHYFSYAKLQTLESEGDQDVTCSNNGRTGISHLLDGMQQLMKQTPQAFAQEIRSLVKLNKLPEALALLDRQYPSTSSATLARDYRELVEYRIKSTITVDEERQFARQLAGKMLELAEALALQPTEAGQRKAMDQSLGSLQDQVNELVVLARDTNGKVSAIGQLAFYISTEIDEIKGELFASGREQRQFERKLEDLIDTLSDDRHPGDEWFKRPLKDKIKIGVNLLGFVKWERELDTSGMRIPKTWRAFKGWFLEEKK